VDQVRGEWDDLSEDATPALSMTGNVSLLSYGKCSCIHFTPQRGIKGSTIDFAEGVPHNRVRNLLHIAVSLHHNESHLPIEQCHTQ